MAGHFAVCHASGYMKTQSYWDMSYPAATTSSSSTIDEMISTVQGHLVEAVRLRLRSDVPLAVYLSGGLDSSAVAGIATHLLRENDPHAKLNTFTLAYLGESKHHLISMPSNCSLPEQRTQKTMKSRLQGEQQLILEPIYIRLMQLKQP